MPLSESYVSNISAIGSFLDSIRTAGVPERVTFEFLKTIGLTSSNDRNVIAVMKGLGFLDQNGVPTDRYKTYRNKNEGGRVLARAMREAYSDIFLANENAQDLTAEKIRNIVAAKSSKGDRVVLEIARTFKALAAKADFSKDPHASASDERAEAPRREAAPPPEASMPPLHSTQGRSHPQFHYNIQIHLPTTTDVAVYNAIFRSLRENLLS